MNKFKTIVESAIKAGWEAEITEDEYISWRNTPVSRQKYMQEYSATWNTESAFPYFIFNHDFLKAVFGELCGDDYMFVAWNTGSQQQMECWQYHAQQLVISEDPIQYLYDYITGDANG